MLACLITVRLSLPCCLPACQASHYYDVQIERFEHLPAEQSAETLIDFSDIRIIGRERALNGTMRIVEDMSNEHFTVSVDFQTDPLNNGYWRNMVFALPSLPVCTAFATLIGPYGKSTLVQGVNTDMPFDGQQCPLPRGTYYMKRLLMNTDTWPRIMPFGGLKGIFRFVKRGKMIGGCSLITSITSKLS
ncbi:hypothetical protein KR222_009756, partial [Zaprionus bogoriensis]